MADTSEILDTSMGEITETSTTTTKPPSEEPKPNSSSSTTKRRKRKPPKETTLTQITLRDPPWAYMHLQHLTSNGPAAAAAEPLDAVTAHLHLTAALAQFLGLHGTAIPIDILKLDGGDVWIRVPSQDRSALMGAVGGWVSGKGEGWRVRGSSSWDARAMARDGGQDLFV